MMTGTSARPFGRGAKWLAAAVVAIGLYALFVAWTGGFDTRLAGVRIRSRAWERPALVSLVGAIWLLYRCRLPLARVSQQARTLAGQPRVLRAFAGAAAVWTVVAGLAYGTFACGGADSYGYVGQARLFLEGRLTDTVPMRAAFRWPDAEATLIPLGFTAGGAAGVIAPTYPPGLPLLMAPLAAISGRAIYLFVPFCGVLAVWLTYRIGVELGDPLAGVMAAMLLSISPTFLYQLVQPMSDVPVTACWLGALLLSARGTAGAAAAAGLVASIAVMIRPNLAPLAALVLVPVVFGGRASRWRRAAVFASALAPGLMALAWIQHVRYGSLLASGYGTLEQGFAVGNLAPNLARYPRWITASHTPFIWLWALAPFWIRRRAAGRLPAWTALLLSLAVWAAYLPYAYFQPHEWFYTRFLLPALPLMLFFAAATALSALRRLPAASRAPVTAFVFLALAGLFLQFARSHNVFDLRRQESKYPIAGAFVRDQLPSTAFVLAAQHSGSIRYYANRPTLRWDLLDAAHLDDALASLREEGYQPFAVLDADEAVEFRRKFTSAGQRSAGELTLSGVPGGVRVYSFGR